MTNATTNVSKDRDLSKAITDRVERIRRGEDPQLIGKMPSGWAILANQQPDALPGCCMLLPDPVVPAPTDLSPDDRAVFMTDLIRLGEIVLRATTELWGTDGAEWINYLILCNQVPELHGHVVPRYKNEDAGMRNLDPFAAYDFRTARSAEPEGVDAELFEHLKRAYNDMA